jgi:putative FmdB family regulatory protein
MPLYEYQCDACGHRFEKIQKFSDPLVDTCPKCGSTVRKLMSSPAFQFKGSGFYITDYAKKDYTDATNADKESTKDTKEDTKGTKEGTKDTKEGTKDTKEGTKGTKEGTKDAKEGRDTKSEKTSTSEKPASTGSASESKSTTTNKPSA